MDNFTLEYKNDPDPNELKFLDDKIFENSFMKIGQYSYEKMVLLFRDINLNIVAGLYGHTGLGWFYIDVLWVNENFRSKGLGTRLLEAAENEAINRGCYDVYLYTYSFQKPKFYENLGYQVFGQLDNFPIGHIKYFMNKALAKRNVEDQN